MTAKADRSPRPMDQLAAPPRALALSVRIRLLFGGMLNQVGWVVMALGFVVSGVFLPRADVSSLWQFSGALQRAEGIVVDQHVTPGSDDKRRIYAIDYKFKAPSGSEHEGTSYRSESIPSVGQTVKVEYPSGRPTRSRIVGMRRAIFGPFVGLAVVFPLLGVGFVGRGIVKGLRAARLMRLGRGALGVLIDEPTAPLDPDDEAATYSVTFEFEVDGRRYRAKATKTYVRWRGADGPKQLVVYDERDPRRAAVVLHLPGRPHVDEEGHFRAGNPWLALLVLIMPAVSAVLFVYALQGKTP